MHMKLYQKIFDQLKKEGSKLDRKLSVQLNRQHIIVI